MRVALQLFAQRRGAAGGVLVGHGPKFRQVARVS
jgi:hypothetical protein